MISVLMPVYNLFSYPEGWFERAVESVNGCELCIVDDCSTDKTFDYLSSLKDVKVGRTKANSGGAEACNVAAGMATGDYFILLSCRSWYEPGSLKSMSEFLDKHPDVGFVYGQTHFYNDHRFGDWVKVPDPFNPDDFLRRFASSFGYLYRREAWDAGCKYDCTVWIEEAKRFMTIADYDMAMQLIFKMNWRGFALRDVLALNYEFGGKQMNDLLEQYHGRIKQEFRKRWGFPKKLETA